MKTYMRIILIIILIFLIIWVFSLAKSEIYSHIHSAEFFGLDESSTNMLNKSENVKVLEYTEKYSKVYYYNRAGGSVLEFTKKNNGWKMLSWNTVWSDTGSASNIVWPYWWHFIYGGF